MMSIERRRKNIVGQFESELLEEKNEDRESSTCPQNADGKSVAISTRAWMP